MKFTALLLTGLAALTSAAPANLAERDIITFYLSPESSAPAPIPTLGEVSWLGEGVQAKGGPLGWFTAPDTVLKAFIQYNRKEGIAFDSTNTARTVYLKDRKGEVGQGEYEAILGNPRLDEHPELTHERDFTVATITINEVNSYWFGYNGAVWKMWSACETPNEGWRLYFGAVTQPKPGCTENFSLEVGYTNLENAA